MPCKLKPGDKVKAVYAARWKGTVVEVECSGKNRDGSPHYLASVRQEVDRCGNPIRMRKVVRYDVSYFVIEP